MEESEEDLGLPADLDCMPDIFGNDLVGASPFWFR